MSDLLRLFSQFSNLVSWVGMTFSQIIYNFYNLMRPAVEIIGLMPDFVRSFLISSFAIEFIYLILGR